MAYSKDLRTRVLDFIKAGGKKVQAASHFNVCRATVFNWLAQPDDHQPHRPGPKSSYKFDRQQLREEIQQQPDRLLKELAASRGVSVNTISHALKKMGITRKKKRCTTSKA